MVKLSSNAVCNIRLGQACAYLNHRIPVVSQLTFGTNQIVRNNLSIVAVLNRKRALNNVTSGKLVKEISNCAFSTKESV